MTFDLYVLSIAVGLYVIAVGTFLAIAFARRAWRLWLLILDKATRSLEAPAKHSADNIHRLHVEIEPIIHPPVFRIVPRPPYDRKVGR